MTKFKSKGMQWCYYYYVGNDEELLRKAKQKGYPDKMLKQIGYYMPEERIEKESCKVLFDSEQLLVLLTQNKLICQFENN